MASRRPHAPTYAEKAAAPAPAPEQTAPSDIAPAVPANVIFKLLAFTAAMIAAPIGMYFLSVDTIFQGNSTYAGITAAVTANVVLFSYVFVAWKDDQGERMDEAKKRERKAQ